MKFIDDLFGYYGPNWYQQFAPGACYSFDLAAEKFNKRLWISLLIIFIIFFIIKCCYVNSQWMPVDKNMEPTEGIVETKVEHKVPINNSEYYEIETEVKKSGNPIHGYINKNTKEFVKMIEITEYIDLITVIFLVSLIILGVLFNKRVCF